MFHLSFLVLLPGLLGVTVAPAAVRAASDSATYHYDGDGRIWKITYANGTVITYTYDSAGNRQQAVTSCSGSSC